jgi:hypothetical protein
MLCAAWKADVCFQSLFCALQYEGRTVISEGDTTMGKGDNRQKNDKKNKKDKKDAKKPGTPSVVKKP